MPSELDLRVKGAIDDLTGPGGMLPLTDFTLPSGATVPMIAAAPANLVDYFGHFCQQHADTCFLVDGDERLTFAQTYGAARKVASSLIADHGVQKGDRIGIAMRNAPAWVVLYMGIMMAGGVATLLNGWWQGNELADGIADVGCSLVFVDPPRAKRLAEHGRPTAAKIVTVDLSQPLAHSLAGVMRDEPADLPALTGDDLATILFTSGSTGQSKGAYSTHRAVVQGTFNYIAMALMLLRIGTEDGTIKPNPPPHAMLLTVPLFHVTGEIPMLLVSFAIGRKLVFMPKWDALQAMQLIEREKVTNFTGVPLMSWEILNHPDRDKYDLSSVQGFAAGGAPRPPEHVRRLAEEMHSPPSLGYGLTETNAVGAGNFSTNYLAKPNSTGFASKPLVELAIIDDAGKHLATGEKGEVCIRSVALFSGYWHREQATKDAMTDDGYFRTGDIGYLDEDGYLFIVDRKKDIIIRGGENISCQEVEAAIYEHPAVGEACVFGLPDERLGEVPGAVVHPLDGETLDTQQLCDWLKDHLAAFKVPQRVWISADPLPKLGTEKIDKVGLRATYREIHARETAAAA
jgi:acyl-CoA synthetase (AMP-forming)/AMP-acid ligase II